MYALINTKKKTITFNQSVSYQQLQRYMDELFNRDAGLYDVHVDREMIPSIPFIDLSDGIVGADLFPWTIVDKKKGQIKTSVKGGLKVVLGKTQNSLRTEFTVKLDG